MTLRLYTLHDSKANRFTHPMTMMNDGDAIRGFTTVLNTPNTSYNLYPDDFTLFAIGEFDELTGKITPFQIYDSLGNGAHLKPGGPQITQTPQEIYNPSMPEEKKDIPNKLVLSKKKKKS